MSVWDKVLKNEERKKVFLAVETEGSDIEMVATSLNIVSPLVISHIVQLRKAGLVDYKDMQSTARLTEKGRLVRQELAGTRTV